ncbi:hypothetical protein KPL70_004968 [Citrus sinensis]|nr:hypothetical protein KPL70_004968 [Citrus sinensis]
MYIRSTKNYLLYSFPGEVSLRLKARIQMRSFKLFIFFPFLSFVSIFLRFTTAADPEYLAHNCPNTTTFSRNRTSQSNLHLFFSSLPTNASRSNGFFSRFYNATAGQDSDRVYGLFLGRGDLGSSACQGCLAFAARNVNIKISFFLMLQSP